MLPFYLFKKIPFMEKKLKKMYRDRALQIVPKFLPHILKKDEIIDIGCGTGTISKLINESQGNKITLVDVGYNQVCDMYPVIIYDGKKLPFANNQFDKALLIAVLHHASDTNELIREASRVTSDKIIVMEDVFSDLLSRIITFVGDCLVNFEIHSPFTNHTKDGWIDIFQKNNLIVSYVQEFKLRCVGFPFKLAIFVLSKKAPRLRRRAFR